jgi:hypothetical protein
MPLVGPVASTADESMSLGPFALGGAGLLAFIGAGTRRGRRWLIGQWRHLIEGAR